MELGRCPEITIAYLHSLVLRLAPHVRSTNIRLEPADGGPLTWEPVLLNTDRVEWCFDDGTAEIDTVGCYTIHTKEGLERITDSIHGESGQVTPTRTTLAAQTRRIPFVSLAHP